MSEPILLEIALPTPLRRRFDYLPPVDFNASDLQELSPGVLVRVPFGHQEMTGVLIKTKTYTDQDTKKLRPALALRLGAKGGAPRVRQVRGNASATVARAVRASQYRVGKSDRTARLSLAASVL